MKLYLQATNTDTVCATGLSVERDLGFSAGSSNINLATTSMTWERSFSADRLVDEFAPSSKTITVYLKPGGIGTADGYIRWRLQAVDANCAVLASSAYSDVYDGAAWAAAGSTGVSSALALSWPAGAVRLRLEVELMSGDGASQTFRIVPGSMSYLDAPFRGTRLGVITDAIVSRLAAIAEASGYNVTIGRAEAEEAFPLDGRVIDFPAAYVFTPDVAARGWVSFGEVTDGIEATASFPVVAYVKGGSDAQEAALTFCGDIARAIEAAPDGLGLAQDYAARVVVTAVEQLRAPAEEQRPYGIARLTVEVTYRMPRGML